MSHKVAKREFRSVCFFPSCLYVSLFFPYSTFNYWTAFNWATFCIKTFFFKAQQTSLTPSPCRVHFRGSLIYKSGLWRNTSPKHCCGAIRKITWRQEWSDARSLSCRNVSKPLKCVSSSAWHHIKEHIDWAEFTASWIFSPYLVWHG